MSRNKKKITSGKTFNIIISIIIAIFLWVYVIAEVNPVTQQTMAAIPVQLLNSEAVSAHGLALGSIQNFTVDVIIEGKRRESVKVTSGQIVVTADIAGLVKGENLVPVSVAVPEGMTILQILPARINVTVEELVTEAKPVKVKFVGTADPNSEPGGIAIEPLKVNISGAKSAVSAVAALEASINVSDLSDTPKTIQVQGVAVDSAGKKIDNIKSSVDNVSVTGRLLTTKDVKLDVQIVGQLNPIYEIKYINIPSTIKIKGDLDLLQTITDIKAEPIDISQLKATSKQPIKLILPEGIEVAAGNDALTAEVGISELASQKFVYSSSEISIQNLEPSLKASVKALQITVTASGSPEIINSLVKTDITPFIDLSGKQAGVGNVTVGFTYSKQIDGVISDPAEVFVDISQQ